MGGANQGLWKQLNIKCISKKETNKSKTKQSNKSNAYEVFTSFMHPSTNKRVWVFPDMPHLLKLLRNNFLDYGITFPDNTTIDKETVRNVIEDQELKLSPKLTHFHIDLRQSARQKVKYAAQLFSHHTACLMKLKYPNNKNVFNLFETTDKFFDVMNSRFTVDQSKKWHSAFGIDFVNQLQILNNMENMIKSIRFTSHGNWMPFQKGFLISIASIKGIFNDLKEYGVKYLITCRFNQDVLESFFSRIRSAGNGYKNPTPTEFKHRFHRILLGSELPLPNASNVSESENCSTKTPYLTSEIFLNFQNSTPTCATTNDVVVLDDDFTEIDFEPEILDYTRREALRYIAGYLAFKSKDSTLSENDSLENGWIEILTRGGLRIPNKDLMELVVAGNSL